MDIGEEEESIRVEPVEDPFKLPKEKPVENPEPIRVPKPEKVPAGK